MSEHVEREGYASFKGRERERVRVRESERDGLLMAVGVYQMRMFETLISVNFLDDDVSSPFSLL